MEIRGTNCEWIWTGGYLEVTTEDLSGSIVINDELTIGIPPNTTSKFNNIIIAGTKMPSFNDGATDFSVDDFAIKKVEMKTSYEGCNKEIADSLKCGEHIKCLCNGNPYTIIAYMEQYDYPYISTANQKFNNAIPIKKETYVIDAVSMMKGLIERGYHINLNGDWIDNSGRRAELVFMSHSFFECGKKPDSGTMWKPWMLEEVEI